MIRAVPNFVAKAPAPPPTAPMIHRATFSAPRRSIIVSFKSDTVSVNFATCSERCLTSARVAMAMSLVSSLTAEPHRVKSMLMKHGTKADHFRAALAKREQRG